MSAHTASVSVIREPKIGKSYVWTGYFENYPDDDDTAVDFPAAFNKAKEMEDYTGERFGIPGTLNAAAVQGRRRCFSWTPGTGIEGRYYSPSFWEDQECPALSLFVDVDGVMTRVIYDNLKQAATLMNGGRGLSMATDRQSRLLISRLAGASVGGDPVLLMKGVHAYSKVSVQCEIARLEDEAQSHDRPTDVKGKLAIAKTWADMIGEWQAGGTDVHISAMPEE